MIHEQKSHMIASPASTAPDHVKITRALLSVSDKTGLEDFARSLVAQGVLLLSTGGTAKALRDAGLAVTDVSDHTGFPEMMDGRVKTLHPKIHGGLLALRDNADHQAAAQAHDIPPIDLVCVTLYPFEQTVASGADAATIIENIDIGGPSMVRSAAKNHGFVTIITDPADYARTLEVMAANTGATTFALRQEMAAKAFARTAQYDAAISSWFAFGRLGQQFPETLNISATRHQELRYGENPHQKAAVYRAQSAGMAGLIGATQIQGKELSYNNFNDTDAAFELISEFSGTIPAVAIIKHANPCGVATGVTLAEAYARAFDCDRVSAFGGIIACNQALDEATAKAITEIFTEVVVAPGADDAAKAIFAAKKNLRLLLVPGLRNPATAGLVIKSIAGGYLLQSRDNGVITQADLKVVTRRAPTEAELADLLFAFKVAKHVKSNAIVYAKNGATVGVGAGQMSRLDSTRIAARKAQDMADAIGMANPPTHASVVASDAFFPFADGLLAAADAGATAIIQPGGSMRDADVIAAADARNLAMVFTGMRHFRH
jgi:phosphoribosylaminoimidazolecarboxamide formyltransferase / IMP cyclohydrolase